MSETKLADLIYIAGPMKGYEDKNFPAFEDAALRLRAAGYRVISPTTIETIYGHGKDYKFYLRQAIRLLINSQAVATLPNYEASSGAMLEVTIAKALDMTVGTVDWWIAQASSSDDTPDGAT